MSKSRDIADSAATINFIDTVTSNVQNQIDNIDPLPGQTGNSGKFLTTNGSAASWDAVDVSSEITGTLPAANGGTGITAAGASGNVLTSTGSGWASTAPAAGGAWELLATYTPSSASTVNVEAFSSTYDDYVIIGTLTSASAIPRIRVKLGSGSYATDGNYAFYELDYNSFTNTSTAAHIQMGSDIGSGSSANNIKMSFITNCFNVNDSTYQGVFGTTNNATSYNMRGLVYSGYYHGATGVLTGIQYSPNSGSYTGTVRIYGIKKT